MTRKEQLTLIVHHEDFKNDDDTYIELYAVKRYWKVHKEGDYDYFFDAQAPTNEQEDDKEQRLRRVQIAATYFLNKPKIDSLQSRRLIAKALINNEYLQSGVSPRSGRKRHSVDHVLLTVPHFQKFVKG